MAEGSWSMKTFKHPSTVFIATLLWTFWMHLESIHVLLAPSHALYFAWRRRQLQNSWGHKAQRNEKYIICACPPGLHICGYIGSTGQLHWGSSWNMVGGLWKCVWRILWVTHFGMTIWVPNLGDIRYLWLICKSVAQHQRAASSTQMVEQRKQ